MDEITTDNDAHGVFAQTMQSMALVDCESMELSNDPRFFQDNVIDKRLAAFAGLSTVSGLLVDTCLGEVLDMNKDFQLNTGDGWIQCIGLYLLTAVLVVMVLATYIGVVQTYHTIRLMTGGATGFEMAAGYYLNKNIVFFRHLSVKMMLVGLPTLLISTGLRLLHKFNKDQANSGPMLVTYDENEVTEGLDPTNHPNFMGMTFTGLVTAALYVVCGVLLFCVHIRHQAVFREKYEHLGHGVPFLVRHTATIGTTKQRRLPDV